MYAIFLKFANVKMLSAHFLLLEALKDSKIPYLLLTDLVSVEFHRPQKMPCYLIFSNQKNESTELSLENNFP